MELNYLYGSKITKEIKQGKAIHAEMEEAVNVPIELNPTSYPDVVYKILYTSTSALDALMKNHRAREIQAYGTVKGIKLVGKIDELDRKDDEIFVWEDKTKGNDNLPSDAQLLTGRIQVMIYRKMLEDIRSGRYALDAYVKDYSTSFMKISDNFSIQLNALGIAKGEQTVNAMAERYFGNMRRLSRISDTLHVRYINQLTGKEIKTYQFKYDENEMHDMLEFSMQYWHGERESLPVPKEEKWKCNFCAFFGNHCKVWWGQKALI
jgi:exonuclease V